MPPQSAPADAIKQTDNDVKLAQIALDAKTHEWNYQIQKMKIRWVSFTGAILLAVITAVGGWQQGWFKFSLESKTAEQIQFTTTAEIERDYLDRFMQHALNNDLQYRSDFALYFSKTAITAPMRDNWNEYYKAVQMLLKNEQKKVTQNAAKIDELRKDETDNTAKIAALEAEIAALNTRIQGTSVEKSVDVNLNTTVPAIPPVNSDMSLLHLELRNKVKTLLDRLHDEGHKFELFEGFRSAKRQTAIQAERERIGNGSAVGPWASVNNYGLAANLVLKIEGKWSWQTDGEYAKS